MARPNRYSPEVRERAVRMLHEQESSHPSRWAAMQSIAEKIGCTAETLRKWVREQQLQRTFCIRGIVLGTTRCERLAAIRQCRWIDQIQHCHPPTTCCHILNTDIVLLVSPVDANNCCEPTGGSILSCRFRTKRGQFYVAVDTGYAANPEYSLSSSSAPVGSKPKR